MKVRVAGLRSKSLPCKKQTYCSVDLENYQFKHFPNKVKKLDLQQILSKDRELPAACFEYIRPVSKNPIINICNAVTKKVELLRFFTSDRKPECAQMRKKE